MYRSVLRIAGGICAIAWCAAGVAAAEPVQLKLATFGPPQSYFYAEVLIPWMEAVNRDSNGTVNIKYFGGGVLGNAGNMYDAVLTGAADIGWALPGTVPGKFVVPAITTSPTEKIAPEPAGQSRIGSRLYFCFAWRNPITILADRVRISFNRSAIRRSSSRPRSQTKPSLARTTAR